MKVEGVLYKIDPNETMVCDKHGKAYAVHLNGRGDVMCHVCLRVAITQMEDTIDSIEREDENAITKKEQA
jgi:hypothetical protein